MTIQPEQIKQIERLLSETKRIIVHQREKELLLGEKFNVFSILQMERKENGTHSAFLCELLNPQGSHLKGTVFLELFLQTIEDKTIDSKTAKIKPEYHVGKKDVLGKTGGRIDIHIWDKDRNSISIENKIDAYEQEAQIERYCNYNKGKNKVYYLTKYGVPSEECKGKLKIGEDYYLLSYKEDITKWLQLCMKEAFDAPILRETIKQYYILIKKLTLTMNKEEEKELFDTILRNHEEALIIASNLKSAVCQLNGNIRQKIFDCLRNELNGKYIVRLDSAVEKPYSQIWIKVSGKEEAKIFFGIQSFSFEKDVLSEGLFIGIFVLDGKYLPEYDELGERISNWWIAIENIDDFEGYKVSFQDSKTIKKLNSDQLFQEKFINHIVEKTVSYLDIHVESVSALLNDNLK